eukprot:12184097-Karenia_brevis.AAC.1
MEEGTIDQNGEELQIGSATLQPGSPHELWHGDMVVVFTDGACRHNQFFKFRRAGVGVFWAVGHVKNISAKLEGSFQSNQRAELQAILLALRAECRPVEIRTDSKYCMDSWHRYVIGKPPSSWYGIVHGDLWAMLVAEVSLRQNPARLTKVKGHANDSDVLRGRVQLEDKIGNDWADFLATSGADQHSLDVHVVDRAVRLSHLTKNVQSMMVDIICARGQALSNAGS